MSSGEHLSNLVAGARAGCNRSAAELCAMVGPEVLREIRKRITPAVRRRFDSRDFTQEVWAAFFAHLPEGVEFHNVEQLRAYLMKIARFKVIDAVRQSQTTKWTSPATLDGGDHADSAPASPDATASQWLMAAERWDELLRRTPENHRPILLLLRDGHGQKEIADRLGISEKTVRRLVRRLEQESAP